MSKLKYVRLDDLLKLAYKTCESEIIAFRRGYEKAFFDTRPRVEPPFIPAPISQDFLTKRANEFALDLFKRNNPSKL